MVEYPCQTIQRQRATLQPASVISISECSFSQVQPIRVEVAPGQVEICQVYEMEELLSVASTRIATMYHNNPVSSLSPVTD